MTRQKQKDEERAHIDYFLDTQALRPATVLPGESPDFLLRFEDGRRVAVEVTTLVDRRAAIGAAAIRRLRGSLRDRLERESLTAAVWLSMVSQGSAALHRNPKILRGNVVALVEIIRAQLYEAEDDALYEYPVLRAHGVRYLNWLRVRRSAELSVGRGLSAANGGVRRALIQERIADKDEKLDGYRAAVTADEYWLLLVGGSGPDTSGDAAAAEAGIFDTRFDRVYFLDLYAGRAVRLERSP